MWRSHIFWRLFATYSVLVTLALGLLGWILLARMEAHVREDMRRDLETKCVLVRELVALQDLVPTELQRQVSSLADEIQCRITLVAEDGRVLADSAEEPRQMNNHLHRPEI